MILLYKKVAGIFRSTLLLQIGPEMDPCKGTRRTQQMGNACIFTGFKPSLSYPYYLLSLKHQVMILTFILSKLTFLQRSSMM